MKDEAIFRRRDDAGKGSGKRSLAKGAQGERVAAEFLVRRGLAIISRNYRCRRGELDLIARDGDTLVFVEVRWRTGTRFGGPAESIDAHKMQRLTCAARHYLGAFGLIMPCRFDVVLIDGQGETLTWLRNVCLS